MRGRLPVALVLATLLAGCCRTLPPPGTLEGYVQAGPTHPPLSGAQVVLRSPHGVFQTLTDAEGRFRLDLPQGEYALEAHLEGFAGSLVEGLRVGERTRFDPLVLPAFYPAWPRTPPRLSLEGPAPEGLLAPGTPLRLQATASLPIRVLLLGVGRRPSLPLAGPRQRAWYGVGDTGWFTLPGESVEGPGAAFLHAVAYDQNNNRAERLLPVRLPPPSASPPPVASPALEATAYTLAQPLRTLALDDRPPSVLVRLAWTAAPGAEGYRLYREGYLLSVHGPSEEEAYDQGADLQPGREVCYRLEAWSQGAPLPPSRACVTPLPAFQVELLSPRDTGPAQPTFQVDFTPEPPTPPFLRLALFDLHTGQAVRLFPGAPAQGRAFPWTQDPLLPGRAYTWGVYLAYAVDDPDRPRAYSLAVDQGGVFLGQVLRGPTATFEVRP